jgi:hypothetical protein
MILISVAIRKKTPANYGLSAPLSQTGSDNSERQQSRERLAGGVKRRKIRESLPGFSCGSRIAEAYV